MKKINSISKRISFKFSIFLSILIIFLTSCFFTVQTISMRIREQNDLKKTADKLEKMIEQSNDLEAALNGNTGIPYFISWLVFDRTTQKIVGTDDPFLPVLKETNGMAEKYFEKNYFADGNLDIYYLARSAGKDDRYLVMTSFNLDHDMVKRSIQTFPLTLLFILIPILLISYFACLTISKQTLKPITDMTRAAEKISASNLEQQLPVTAHNDELDELASTFNKLFARLKTDFDRERAFTSNVSHELKTPVAVIQGNAKLLQRWGKDDPVQLEKSLKAIGDETKSMTAIITNLLQLSHLENKTTVVNKGEFSLQEFLLRIKENTASYSPLTEFHLPENMDYTLNTDQELLYQTFNILVNNSIKFNDKEACEITINAEKTDDEKIHFTFADNGPGIPEDAMPHIFERFYRADESHNRKIGGSGLGLSIAKEIMNVLDGTIQVEKAGTTGGAVFSLTV